MDLLSCWGELSLTGVSGQITFLEEIEMGMSTMHDEDKLTVSTNYNGPSSTVLSPSATPLPLSCKMFSRNPQLLHSLICLL